MRSAPRAALPGLPVAPDVAVLAADDHVDRVLVEGVHAAHRRGGDAGEAALVEHVARAVAELEADAPAVDEVELLLLVVVVARRGVAGRLDDGVDAERGHAQRRADLAEAVPVAERVQMADRVALALDDLSHRFFAHAADPPPAGARGS